MRIRLYVLKKIKKYLKTMRGSIIGLGVITLCSLPISFVSPKFFQILIDDVIGNRNFRGFGFVVVGLLMVYLMKLISEGISLLFRNKILNAFTYGIRFDIWNKYDAAPFAFLEKKEIGDLKMRMIDDVDSLGNFVEDQIVNYITNFLMIIIAVVLLSAIHLKMLLCCCVILPIVFFVDQRLGQATRNINGKIRMETSDYYTSTHNSLQFWKEIKLQSAELTFIERFKKYREKLAILGFKSIRYWACTEVFNDFKVNYLTKVFVCIIGAFFVMKNEISVGSLVLFSEYFSMLFSSIDGVNTKRVSLRVNEPYYRQIFETLEFPETPIEGMDVVTFHDCIEIKNMSFSYQEGQAVLQNINLCIKKGEYIALVGKTGCGKTTLIKILLGLYPPQKGCVTIDGKDINALNKAEFYQKIGVVMQDNFLFDTSIRENLLLTNPEASEDDVIQACKQANIYEFIASLPDGLDTKIGERGIRLSGGQKQRISIAAVLLKRPEIIIFDEATSSLDKVSEDIIHDVINTLVEKVTIIVITHKPSTALRANRVIVMEDREVVATGTHEMLVEKNKFYRQMMEEKRNEK